MRRSAPFPRVRSRARPTGVIPRARAREVKAVGRSYLPGLHRVRERLVCQRTSVINQIRAFLLERGIAVRLRTAMPNVLAMTDKLSPRMIHMIEDLCTDWRYLDSRIVTVSNEIETLSEQDDGANRLMTVPGIGPVVVAAPWADRLTVSARTSGGHREREGVSLFIVDRHAPNIEDGVQQCLILGAASVGLCTPLIGCRSGGLGRP
jgi:transposase